MKPNKINKMLDMVGTRPPLAANRDWDGDKVKNIIDCQPRNPKKQGVMHWIKAKRTGRPYSEVSDEDIKAKKEARTAAYSERASQMKETAIYREKASGERKRKYIKEGGFIGMVSKQVSAAKPRSKIRYSTKTKGKKRKYAKQKSKRSSPSVTEFKMDMPKFNF